jgi:chaperonin GroEL (HSP60 family)
MTYEFRLFRLRRLLGVEKISCAHQNEPERKKKSLAAARRAPSATPRPVSLLTALGDARRISRGRGVVMAGTASDDLEYAINAIRKLTALVDHTAYGGEPEEADEAQRQGHEAIRRLRVLKTEPNVAVGGGQPEDRAEDAEDALAA